VFLRNNFFMLSPLLDQAPDLAAEWVILSALNIAFAGAAAVVHANTAVGIRNWSLRAPVGGGTFTVSASKGAALTALRPHPAPDDLILEPKLTDASAWDDTRIYTKISPILIRSKQLES
jgi:hypothetical protein